MKKDGIKFVDVNDIDQMSKLTLRMKKNRTDFTKTIFYSKVKDGIVVDLETSPIR